MRFAKLSSGLLTAAVVGLVSLAAAPAGAQVPPAAQSCNNCHGANGVSTTPTVPTIAGMSAKFLTDNIAAYKKKDRACPETTVVAGDKKGTKTTMCDAVASLSDADVAAVAKFYAGQKYVPAPAQTFDAAQAAEGKALHEKYCDKCHTKNGTDAADDAGFLAGQWSPYLKEAFAEMKEGKRYIPEKMKALTDKMQDKHFEAVINYYASVK